MRLLSLDNGSQLTMRYSTGGTHRAFGRYSWHEFDSGKVALSRPAAGTFTGC